LQEQIGAIFKQKTLADWILHFKDWDCCCEPILNFDEVMGDPEMHARKMVVEMVHETWGAYRQMGFAPKFSATPGEIRTHAPALGEHTAEILGGLGYTDREMADLKERGAV
jgi:crotonobetainyl-CoA:carnitine CoA-transferase CaiB-like acyl-CoA transferase